MACKPTGGSGKPEPNNNIMTHKNYRKDGYNDLYTVN